MFNLSSNMQIEATVEWTCSNCGCANRCNKTVILSSDKTLYGIETEKQWNKLSDELTEDVVRQSQVFDGHPVKPEYIPDNLRVTCKNCKQMEPWAKIPPKKTGRGVSYLLSFVSIALTVVCIMLLKKLLPQSSEYSSIVNLVLLMLFIGLTFNIHGMRRKSIIRKLNLLTPDFLPRIYKKTK